MAFNNNTLEKSLSLYNRMKKLFLVCLSIAVSASLYSQCQLKTITKVSLVKPVISLIAASRGPDYRTDNLNFGMQQEFAVFRKQSLAVGYNFSHRNYYIYEFSGAYPIPLEDLSHSIQFNYNFYL